MDISALSTSLGYGLGIGICILLISTMIFLPVSYAMNRFIYHRSVLRLLMGCFTVLVAPIAFIIIILHNTPVHYFGLMPLMDTASKSTDGDAGFLLPLFYSVLTAVFHPFVEFHGEDNSVGFNKSIEHLMAAEGAPAVNEALMEEVVAAGRQTDEAAWKSAMTALMPKFEHVAATVATVATVGKDLPPPSEQPQAEKTATVTTAATAADTSGT